MPSQATTLPLPRTRYERARAAAHGARVSLNGRPGTQAGDRAGAWLAGVALAAIVALSLVLVLMVANRPSGLSPTTHTNFFPGWMAGPLGGLWPGLTRDGNSLRYLFTAVVIAMYVAYLVLLRYVGSVPARWVIAAIGAVHVIFLLAPPMALTDIFNYINYARMEVVHGLNPYTTIPIVEPHSDPSFTLSNWHQLLSPYGPLFTLLTFAFVPLGVAASFWALKALLVLSSLATLALVWSCARMLGRDPRTAVAFVGLNPIVLVWGLGGDHNDFLMLLSIMLGFNLLLRARAKEQAIAAQAARDSGTAPARPARRVLETRMAAGAAFVVAAAFKASGAILIPIVLAAVLRSRRAIVPVVAGMLAAASVLAVASLIAFGLHVPDLSTQGRLVTTYSVPNLVGLALGAGGETEALRIVMSLVLAATVLACCRAAYRRRDAIAASGWASLALLLTLSWVLPWYVVWVLPLAAVAGSKRLRSAAVVVGVYLIVAWSPASGLLWNAIGFHPERTPLGRLHQRYVRELLN
jgi:hypothetical protein